jgi:hypothetical protein
MGLDLRRSLLNPPTIFAKKFSAKGKNYQGGGGGYIDFAN